MNHLAIVIPDHLSISSIQYTMNRDELIYGCFIRFLGILVPTSSRKGCTIWLYGSLLAAYFTCDCDSGSEIINPINTNKTSIENNRDFGENSLLGKRGNSLTTCRFVGIFGLPRSLLWLYLWFIGRYGAKLPWHHWRRTWWSQINGVEVWWAYG